MTFTVNASLLDAIVLSVVSMEDTYGYKITQEVNKIIGVSESTLYPVLRRLQKDSNLEVYDMEYLGRNRRYYKITGKGRILLNLYQEEWTLYKEKIDRVFSKNFAPFAEFPEDERDSKGKKDKKDKKDYSREGTDKPDDAARGANMNQDRKDKQQKPPGKMTAEEKISNLGHKIGETIDNLKIPEKIENLKIGEKFDSLKIPEKIENLKLGEKIEDIGGKIEQFLHKEHKDKLNKDSNTDENKDSKEDKMNGQ